MPFTKISISRHICLLDGRFNILNEFLFEYFKFGCYFVLAGHTLERKDLVFLWEFSDGGPTMSASPVISKSFSLAGNHNINFTAKNLGKHSKTNVISSLKNSFLVKYF
jgi:hypothetical protein